MVPPIASDTFETLENLGGQMKQQTKQAAKTIVNEAKKSVGLGPAESPQNSNPPTDGLPASQETQKAQIQKMEQVSKQKSGQRYKEIQAQILAISHKKQSEIPEQMKGKPGFSEDKMVKQLEEEKNLPAGRQGREAQRKAEQGEKEPLPVQREKKKTEMFRGASG